MRSIIAVLVPVLAGALVYFHLALGGLTARSIDASLLLLPAILIGVMLVSLIFLPLWSVLVHRTRRIRLAFVAIGAAIVLVICAALGALGAFKSDGMEGVALLFVPGLVLVTTFGILMDPRRVRGGEKRPVQQAAGASRPLVVALPLSKLQSLPRVAAEPADVRGSRVVDISSSQ